jgi:hypothetical protein
LRWRGDRKKKTGNLRNTDYEKGFGKGHECEEEEQEN